MDRLRSWIVAAAVAAIAVIVAAPAVLLNLAASASTESAPWPEPQLWRLALGVALMAAAVVLLAAVARDSFRWLRQGDARHRLRPHA